MLLICFKLKCFGEEIIFGVKRKIILLIFHRLGARIGVIPGVQSPAGDRVPELLAPLEGVGANEMVRSQPQDPSGHPNTGSHARLPTSSPTPCSRSGTMGPGL